ncbi:MAG: hypothetical protein V2I47_09580 [Bacteroidales bacterium]|jgi:hypothetical protein|nr:hypothetical protein [Bacteroidales bacterium]
MINKSKILLSMLLATMLMLGSCDTGDDNNPSPVPDARDKFVGNWAVNNENCGKSKYVAGISKDASNSAQVLVTNFGFSGSSEPDTAIIAGSSIVLYKQLNAEGWEIQGTGFYKSDESIEWTYSLLISGNLENCTATYVKN